MTKAQHVRHILFIVLTALAAVGVEALSPGGALAHYPWALPVLGAVKYAMTLFDLGAGPPAAAAVLLFALLGCSGCKSVLGPVPPPGTPGFVNCSDAALHAAALNILPSVETALATASYEAALATLVASVGGPLALSEVECAVAWVASEAARAEVATSDSLEAAKFARAQAWLAAHPVTFAVAP